MKDTPPTHQKKKKCELTKEKNKQEEKVKTGLYVVEKKDGNGSNGLLHTHALIACSSHFCFVLFFFF
jgi:hypothetical protein